MEIDLRGGAEENQRKGWMTAGQVSQRDGSKYMFKWTRIKLIK